jgi:hypothetical protein
MKFLTIFLSEIRHIDNPQAASSVNSLTLAPIPILLSFPRRFHKQKSTVLVKKSERGVLIE